MSGRIHPTLQLGMHADPLASLRAPAAAIADLAFGSLTADASMLGDGHLAILPADALELDLSDPAQCRFGDYELRELIGRGGMGVVYRAYQRSLDREVAMKLLAAGPWASREFVERFRHEAQNAARMQHPNIVAIFEVGAAEEMHFFSMRMVHGSSLAALLKREGRLQPRHAAQLLRTIAEAVDYAHRLGVLHLDLKPANVLLDETGAPHVADFGLARRLDHDLSATTTEVSGTPSYMAPEQATAGPQKITPATDIWGLGAILYELVTGEPPFLGETPHDTLQLVVHGTVRNPRRLAPQLPRDLEAIILKCMARDSRDRYASARALADDLGRFLDRRAVMARPLNIAQRTMRWSRREPKLAATALLAIAAVLIGLAATTRQWRRADANAVVAHRELWDSRDADALRLMESGNGWKAAPLLLANIRDMEAAGDRDRLAGVRKRLGILENANPRLIDAWPAPDNIGALAFTPDGNELVASAVEKVHVYDVASGQESFNLPAPDSYYEYLHFSANGRNLILANPPAKDIVPHPSQLEMRRLDMARREWIAPPLEFASFANASYSDDGRFALLTNADGHAQTWSTDPWRPLSPLRAPPPLNGEPSRLLAPDGSLIAQDAQAHAVLLIDAHTLGAKRRVELGAFGNISAWAFSHDARWLALGDATGAVAVVDCRTFAVRRPSPLPYFQVYSITFSADDRWLAAAATSGGVFLWSWPDAQLLAPPFSGGGSHSVGPDALHALPDPTRGLVLSSDDTDSTALWQIAPTSAADRDDAVPVTALLNAKHNSQVELIAWDAPRNLLAFTANQLIQLQRLPPLALKAGRAARLMPSTLHFDGRHLAEVQGNNVQVVDANDERPAGARVELPQPPDFAELSADGTTLIVVVGPTLHIFDAASGARRFASIALGGSPAFVEPSPDSQRVAVAWVQTASEGDRTYNAVTLMYDLHSGALLGGPQMLPGQAHEMTFSSDGRRLIAWNKLELTLRDGTTLAPVPGPLALFRPNGSANNFDKGMMRVARFNATQEVEIAFGGPPSAVALSRDWELRTYAADGTIRARKLSPEPPMQTLPLPDGDTVVAGWQGGMSIVAADGSGQDLPEPIPDSPRFIFAVSPDGRWLARERRNGIALFDLHGRTFVATLRVAMPQPDLVWQVAFSPDGNHLLARSLMGRLMVWDLAPDLRAPAAIARELDMRELVSARAGSALASVTPSSAERAALRASDPGPPPALSTAVPPPTARELAGGGIPPRAAAATANMLDLTQMYTFGLRETLATVENGGADFHWMPQGVQRLLGIDFDIRGAIGLHAPHVAKFDLARSVAAIDVLVLSDSNMNAAGKDHLADTGLDYADGSKITLPIGFTHDSYYGFRDPKEPPPAPFAAWGFDARTFGDGYHDIVFMLRVPNPHPERPVKALTLSTSGNPAVQAAILAVSVEPAAVLPDKGESP